MISDSRNSQIMAGILPCTDLLIMHEGGHGHELCIISSVSVKFVKFSLFRHEQTLGKKFVVDI